MEVVQFRRDSSSGVVDDIESAAIPLRGSPAALAADRDGPPRPRSATPLVRVGQHRGLEEGKEGAKGKQSIEGRATKEKKKAKSFSAIDVFFSLPSGSYLLFVFYSTREVRPQKSETEPETEEGTGEKYQNGAERGLRIPQGF
jgi:hypothetical protein